MAIKILSTSELPNVPAIYAMCGGSETRYVAYVGVADKLKRRVEQHLVRRDSSVAPRTSAVGLNPDYVTELWWWEHPRFSERYILMAAELVASDVLKPTLRSRGIVPEKAKKVYTDGKFQLEMKKLFEGEPKGKLIILTLNDALDKIEQLEKRIALLEEKMKMIKGP